MDMSYLKDMLPFDACPGDHSFDTADNFQLPARKKESGNCREPEDRTRYSGSRPQIQTQCIRYSVSCSSPGLHLRRPYDTDRSSCDIRNIRDTCRHIFL